MHRQGEIEKLKLRQLNVKLKERAAKAKAANHQAESTQEAETRR